MAGFVSAACSNVSPRSPKRSNTFQIKQRTAIHRDSCWEISPRLRFGDCTATAAAAWNGNVDVDVLVLELLVGAWTTGPTSARTGKFVILGSLPELTFDFRRRIIGMQTHAGPVCARQHEIPHLANCLHVAGGRIVLPRHTFHLVIIPWLLLQDAIHQAATAVRWRRDYGPLVRWLRDCSPFHNQLQAGLSPGF